MPGTDGALGMAMGHVILTEFFRDRQVPYFTDYVKSYTDLPFLVTLRERGDGSCLTGSTAADLGHAGEDAAHQTVLLDSATGEPFLPGGTLASRFSRPGRQVEPRPQRPRPRPHPLWHAQGRGHGRPSPLDAGETEGGGVIRRGVPVVRAR